MAIFYLEYDLRKNRNYDRLYAELERFNAVRVLQSLWAFERFETNCINLRDYFAHFVDCDDALLVSEVKTWAALRADRNNLIS